MNSNIRSYIVVASQNKMKFILEYKIQFHFHPLANEDNYSFKCKNRFKHDHYES